MIRLILSCLLIIFCSQLKAQLNIKVGYTLSFNQAKQNDLLVKAFNENNADILESGIGDLNSMHGITVGTKYRIGRQSIELSWDHLSRQRLGVGETSDMTLFQQELFYSFNQLLLSVESSFGQFGIGSGIGFNKVKIKDRIGNSEVKKTLVSEYQTVARFHLAVNFVGQKTVSFAIKPFIQIPLDKINLAPLAQELEVNPELVDEESFPYFGISFIFYNGK